MQRVSQLSLVAAVLLFLTAFVPVNIAAGQNGTCTLPNSDTTPPFVDRCFHQGVWFSPDTLEYDILMLPPQSSYELRDWQLIEQSVANWETGIKTQGAPWLAGLHINEYAVGREPVPAAAMADPEVIIAIHANVAPLGSFAGAATQSPGICHGLDPLAATYSANDPSWHHHVGSDYASRLAACAGGGRVCVVTDAATLATAPDARDRRMAFDLLSHEIGHCLTLGHVGDATTESTDDSTAYPEHDIMSYESDGLVASSMHCPSNLNVRVIEKAFGHLLGQPGASTAVAPAAAGYVHMHPNAWSAPACVQSTADIDDLGYATSADPLGLNDAADADGDGVPDGEDQCPGHDDRLDADGDGLADGCDANDNDGPLGDLDGDGVANNVDKCPGIDDASTECTGPIGNTFYFGRGTLSSPSGNLDVAWGDSTFFQHTLVMDPEAPEFSDPAVIYAPGIRGGAAHNPFYEPAEWASSQPLALQDHNVEVIWWVVNPANGGLFEPEWDLSLYFNGATTAAATLHYIAPSNPLGELMTEHRATLTGVSGNGTLSVVVDPSYSDQIDAFIVYDGIDAPSRIVISGGNDGDSDGDGVTDELDVCPGFNDLADLDGDDTPDGCDSDRDGDGVANASDAFPDDATEWADSDSDGVGDNSDICPGFDDALDADGDGTPDGCEPPAEMAITSPASGATVSGTVLIEGTVTRSDGGAQLAAALGTPELLQPAIAFVDPKHIVDLDFETSASRQGPPVPSPSDGIGPGTPILAYANGVVGVCTANFVWQDQNENYYLGAAGHCFFLGADEPKTATHGTGADMPSTSHIEVRACVRMCANGGANFLGDAATGLGITEFIGDLADLGSVAYARQGPQIYGQDFGLVRIPEALESLIRPEMPVWNGPVGTWKAPQTDAEVLGNPVFVYGNSVGLGETFATKARTGTFTLESDDYPGAWIADLPAAQGDSGSAVNFGARTSNGNVVEARDAMGILTHLYGHPVTAGTTVQKAVQMAAEAGLAIDFLLEGEAPGGGGGGGEGDPVPETWYAHQTACGTAQRMDQTNSAGDFEQPCYRFGASGEGTLGLTGSFPATVTTRGANAGDEVDARVFIKYDETPASLSTVTAVLRAGGLEVGRGSMQKIVDPVTWSAFGYVAYDISFELANGYNPGAALTWQVFHQGSARAQMGYEGARASSLTVQSTLVTNAAPDADAGLDQALLEGSSVQLGGSCSDEDGAIASCTWSQVSGPAVVVEDAGDGSASFDTPQVDGDATIVLRLTATDDEGSTGADDVSVTVLDLQSMERVEAWIDGNYAGATPIDAGDLWSLAVDFSSYAGDVELETRWIDAEGDLVASDAIGLTVSHDSDGDGLEDGQDNCPADANADQADLDGDGQGDACDADVDGDGIVNGFDNCQTVANADQADGDGDSFGDACDGDRDGDGVANADDLFPDDPAEWADSDGDGVGDNGDACAGHNDLADLDGDGAPDGCDADRDGDGYTNTQETSQGSNPDDAASVPDNKWTTSQCADWYARHPGQQGPAECRVQ